MNLVVDHCLIELLCLKAQAFNLSCRSLMLHRTVIGSDRIKRLPQQRLTASVIPKRVRFNPDISGIPPLPPVHAKSLKLDTEEALARTNDGSAPKASRCNRPTFHDLKMAQLFRHPQGSLLCKESLLVVKQLP